MQRQGLKRRVLLFHKQLYRGALRGVMDMQIGLLFKPPPGRGPQVFHVLKVPPAEQVFLHIVKRGFDLPLGLDRQMLLSAGIMQKLSKSPIHFIRSTASHIPW